MCVTPYIVKTSNGLVPVPCGKCYECLQQWTKDWRFRINAEWRDSVACFYVTLTYDAQHLHVAYNYEANEFQSYLVKADLQKFFKRVRKNYPEVKFRYFAIGEYGGDYNRSHMHVIFFFKSYPGWTLTNFHHRLRKCWDNGFIYVKPTVKRHVNYISKYFNKIDKTPHLVEPFKCMSKGFGLCFLTPKRISYFFRTFRASYPNLNGKGWLKLPRYYRKKLDEWTPSIEPNNFGFKWSDIVSMYPREYKGKDKFFNDFCTNYNDIYREFYRKDLHAFRVGTQQRTYISPDLNPNCIFELWYRTKGELLDARKIAQDKLNKALVQHKYTRLKQNDYG